MPGASPAAAPGPAASAGATIAAAGVQELKCPTCGAPIRPEAGDAVVTCDYCGGSVTLSGQGWREIAKHSMLPLKVATPDAALKVVHEFVDAGLFHRHHFEQSTIAETNLSYVPFWVLPASASSTYDYQIMGGMAGPVATTVGSIAAAELIGGALGRRGGVPVVPVVVAGTASQTRAETFAAQYQFPVVAVKALAAYQPRDYQFGLAERATFDRKALPGGAPVLNGDVGEDAAKGTAKAYVEQLHGEAIRHRRGAISNLRTEVQVSEGELLHVPIWRFALDRKGARTVLLVDGHGGKIIHTVA